MTVDEILFLDFPADFERLCVVRKSDKDFHNVCTDYAAIKLEILKLSKQQNTNDTRFLADLTESLEDLRQEISSALLLSRSPNSD